MLTATDAATLHGRLLLRAEQPTTVGRVLRAVIQAHRPETLDEHPGAHCAADLATYPCSTIEVAALEFGLPLTPAPLAQAAAPAEPGTP